MTSEQINIAIAESVGWQKIMGIWYRPDANSRHITCTSSDGGYTIYPPDYCNDLNAMHEVEKTFNDNQWENYWYTLARIAKGRPTQVCHATALQRAEAYLRTIGKWKD